MKKIITYKVYFLLFVGGLFVASCSKDNVQPDLPTPPEDSVIVTPDISKIDDDIEQFMSRFNVPGLSLAVTKNGKLVYAKGYGYADQENGEKVDTAHLFRIASLSKFITSTGIMKLIDQGQLSMDDKVFGPEGVLGDDFGTTPYPQYITDITIRNLLHHEVGGWGNSSNDPAFTQPSLSLNQLISWVIDNRPLTVQPGTKTDYSNLGFQILGRVIEKLSGKSYVDYLQENILTPSGVKSMQMAEGSLADRKFNEVKYYGQSGQNPYGYSSGVIKRLNSCGGWIASAIDLLRVMVHVDGFSTVPDLLSPSAIQIMTTASPRSNYASGLLVNSSNNWWHGGSLSGSRTWIVRTAKGYNWAILMNTRSTDSEFTSALDKLVWPAVNDAATPWPDIDLF